MTDEERLDEIKSQAVRNKFPRVLSSHEGTTLWLHDVEWLIARVRELTAKCEEKDKRIAELEKRINNPLDW